MSTTKYNVGEKVFYKTVEIEATIIETSTTNRGTEYRLRIETKGSTTTVWAKESELTYVGEGD